MKQLLLATTAVIIGGQAFAADMRLPVKAPPAPPPAYSWTGCSVGVHLGAGWGRSSFSDPNAPLTTQFATPGGVVDDLERTSVLGGAQVGCDYQFASHWVIGAAGDFSWTDIEGQATDPFFAGKNGGPILLNAKTDWFASATARVGYAFDRLLIYAKGGAAWSHDTYSIQNTISWGAPNPNICAAGGVAVACNATGTVTRSGWTVGLGFEWAFARNWTTGIEFDHYDFGTENVLLFEPNAGTSAPISIKQTIDAAKVTLNYRFGPN
jgi:outer membrane immunogenic protein